MSQHIDPEVKQSFIVNDLTTNDAGKALSAAQGKELSDRIKYVQITSQTNANTLESSANYEKHYYGTNLSSQLTNIPTAVSSSSAPWTMDVTYINGYTRQTLIVQGNNVDTYVRQNYYQSGAMRWNDWVSLNSTLNGNSFVSGNFAGGSTVTFSFETLAIVYVFRASSTANPVVAMIDGWNGITYSNKNDSLATISSSNRTVTMTNQTSSYADYLIIKK